MSALCKRLLIARPALKAGLLEWSQSNQIKWTAAVCRYCVNATDGKQVETRFTRPDLNFVGSSQKLTNFQKRLCFISGKYPSVAAVPDHVSDSEFRNAMDICKTLFNIWCMAMMCWFWLFIHIVEKRRMRRIYARAERKEQKKMKKMDALNVELAEQRKLQKLQN